MMRISKRHTFSLFDRLLAKIESVPSSDRFLLRLVFIVVIASSIWLVLSVNSYYSAQTATRGGSITEGIIGTPRFVNPALALTRADQDVTALVYGGLMKIAPDGSLQNNLAETINISPDGTTYTITLKRNSQFHDGTPLTARDVVFTIQLIQNPDLKSPVRGNWSDVTVQEVDEYTLTVQLSEPYTPFVENFTLGIMPAHLWSQLPVEHFPFSQLNTNPIGSGPFRISATKLDPSGLINHYTLTAFRENETNPKLDTLELAFFQNEELLISAVKDRKVDATTYISVENLNGDIVRNKFRLISEPLPRTFGIFFNQNRSTAVRDSAARQALTAAIDRDVLIESALAGFGIPMDSPIPKTSDELESQNSNGTVSTGTPTERATSLLEGAGWRKNNVGIYEKTIDGELVTLSLTLRTSNTPLFTALLEEITTQWEAIGVEVSTEQFEQTGLIQSVIRPRDFQALLFGLDMSRTYDLYPFWHSSQQDDPGLNIAQYANVNVDALLESTRTEQDSDVRNESLAQASATITQETPAVFLFQPNLTYLIAQDISITTMNNLGRPADRFANVAEWHTESDALWPFFRKDM